ncbi:rRNA methyltransferase 1, mitochondrial [Lampris incognitus]|uniref:rRNA methyltransferase 1, mitochondrial n=1 Tax=Lampris incognitus TaxID=2546036 RepID=UPI0024B4ECAD|nr:rRNA methyltransferase 1, mitochondrial [Lampris incognitus]
MGMWNIAYHQRLLIFSSRRFFKAVSNREVVCSKAASYHSTNSLLWPKDTDNKPVVRRRRSPLSKPGLEHRPAIFDEQMDHGLSGSSRDYPKTPALSKNWQKEIPVLKEQRSQGERRMSSELRKLSLEDRSAEWQRPRGERITKDSKEQNYEIVFGVTPCLFALSQRRRKVHKLLVKEGEALQRKPVLKVCEEAHKRGVRIHQVSKKNLDRMCFGRVHQGVCLQATPLSYVTEERASTLPKKTSTPPLWLVLDGIQDPMNLGAILRSAYFLGVDRVASSLRNSCPLTPVVSKASCGIMEIFEVYGYESLDDMIKFKVAQGWQAVGTVGTGEEPPVPVTQCFDFQMTKPTLLLMGGEGEGLSRELLSQCQALLTIPAHRALLPGIDSLNVSVATGILLHSLLSSRRTGQ